MAFAKIFGVISILWAMGVFVYNFLSWIVHLPDLGVLGSWLLNPLGTAFSGRITEWMIGGNPLLWLGKSGIEYLVGGALAFCFFLLLLVIGLVSIKH